jgi:hypothetical protein
MDKIDSPVDCGIQRRPQETQRKIHHGRNDRLSLGSSCGVGNHCNIFCSVEQMKNLNVSVVEAINYI